MGIVQNTELFGVPSKQFNTRSSISKKIEVYGLCYPLDKNKQKKGYLNKVTGKDLVKGAIIQLLKTERGERVMNPDFGCTLRRFLFEPLDETLFQAIKQEIIYSFNTYILGAKILKINVSSGPENSEINVVLTVQLLSEQLTIFDVPITIS